MKNISTSSSLFFLMYVVVFMSTGCSEERSDGREVKVFDEVVFLMDSTKTGRTKREDLSGIWRLCSKFQEMKSNNSGEEKAIMDKLAILLKNDDVEVRYWSALAMGCFRDKARKYLELLVVVYEQSPSEGSKTGRSGIKNAILNVDPNYQFK